MKEDVQTLVLRLADVNGWGYARIFAGLKELGVRLSKTSVANILRENGRSTGDDRGEGTWAEFLKRHAVMLWACDFFSKKVWTTSGLVELFVLFFIHVGSRRVQIAGMTRHPSQAWTAEQGEKVAEMLGTQAEPARLLFRDYDTKFGKAFDRAFAAKGIHVKKTGPCKPDLNAVAERWVQSVKRECLDHSIVFGEAHLRHLLAEYGRYYNEQRPHLWNESRPLPMKADPAAVTDIGEIQCGERLGGLLKHYYRKTG